MSRSILIACLVLGLAGCHAHSVGVVIRDESCSATPPNLVLGPNAEDAWLAARGPERPDWRSVVTGYRFDDLTYYDHTRYDQQSFYGRYGILNDESESVQTGIWLRP